MEGPDAPDERPRGRFYDADVPGAPAVFEFERLTPPEYRVMRRFEYVDRLGHWYRVPVDVEANTTDFASIPFFLTWLVPKDGTHTPAAVLHDALIGGRKGVHYETSAAETIPDRHADYLFREAMERSGVAWLRRWLMWAAVALRTLTVRIEKDPRTGHETQSKRWLRIGLLGVVLGAWTVVSALMALDVPDLLPADRDLDWLADRPWWSEILRALAQVGIGTVAVGAVLGVVLRSLRGLRAGLLGGAAIGFLGLPMVASAVGAAGYLVLQAVTTVLVDGARAVRSGGD